MGAYRVEAHRIPRRGVGMGRIALIGNGWHPKLFREEVRALLGPVDAIHPRIVFAESKASVLERISRASLIDSAINSFCSIRGERVTIDAIVSKIGEWAKSNIPEGTFAVRARRIGQGVGNISRREIEEKTGSIISDEARKVDLDSPEFEIVVILAGPEDTSSHWDDEEAGKSVLWGVRDDLSNGSYVGTSPTERPFFKPVTLDPRLARLMVSLSYRGETPSTVVDPFCGTGGIAIESSMTGIKVLASDLDSRMVEGTRTNLEWANGAGDFSVKQLSAEMIHQKWGPVSGCSFVFDPPYGRNAWTSEDGLDLFINTLSSAKEMCPDGTVCTMLPCSPKSVEGPISEELEVMGLKWGHLKTRIQQTGWKVVVNCPVRVHRSLSRLVVTCHPAD